MKFLATTTALFVLAPSPAVRADPVIVLPSRVAGAPAPPASPVGPAPALPAERIEGDALQAQIETRLSQTPASPTEQEIADLEQLGRRASAAFFGSRFAQARELFIRAGETARAWIDVEGIDGDRIRAVLARSRTLLAVYTLRMHDEQRVDEILTELSILLPDWEPTDAEYPPDIIERMRTAQQRIAARGTATLEVSFHRIGCDVYVNGVRTAGTLLGPQARASVTIPALPPGEHWAHTSCGRRHRRHVLTLRAGVTTQLTIDPMLDAVLLSRPSPMLLFDTSAEQEREEPNVARAIGRTLGAGRVALLRDDGRVVTVEVQPAATPVAGPPVVPVPAAPVEPSGPSDAPRRGPLWPAIGLGGAAVTGAGVGIFLLASPGVCSVRDGLGDCVLTRNLTTEGLVALSVGGVALVAAFVYAVLR